MRKTLAKATLAGLIMAAPSGLPALAQTEFFPGVAKAEVYQGISGGLADLKAHPAFPDNPSEVYYVNFLEFPAGPDDGSPPPGNWGTDYGVRISGFIIPPEDGNYLFFMSSDDAGEFYLSTDDDPANLELLAHEPTWNGVRDYYGTARRPGCDAFDCENHSAPISLQGGERYYFEALMKEGGGGDNLSVAWHEEGDFFGIEQQTGDDGSVYYVPIRGDFLGTFAPTQVEITTQPVDTVGIVRERATFRVIINGVPGDVTYQWRRDGDNIPGATGATYTTPVLTMADEGAEFDVVITGPNNSVTSEVATLSMINIVEITGSARADVFNGIGGTAIANLTNNANYPNNPTTRSTVQFLEFPPGNAEGGAPPGNVMNDYGVRISGLITPTETASYVFYMSADDAGSFYLSTDDGPANLTLVAHEPTWNGVRNYTGVDRRPGCGGAGGTEPCENVSAPISLTAGQKYYFEALMKEGGGGDNLSVAWAKEGDPVPTTPIPGQFLSHYIPERIAIGGITPIALGLRTFTFTVTDAGPSVLDPETVTLTIDGEAAAVTSSKTGGVTTFTHTRATPYAFGSAHTYAISASDTLGSTVTREGNFTAPVPYFPPGEDLPLPDVTDGEWTVRFMYNVLNDSGALIQMTSLRVAMDHLMNSNNPDFTGSVLDTTSELNNFGTGSTAGSFPGNRSDYPLAVGVDAGWSQEDFVVASATHIRISEAGHYTFGMRSDDGMGMRIRGGELISVHGAGTRDLADPEAAVHPGTTGDSNTRAIFYLTPGVYRLEYVWYERGGGDFGEIFVAHGSFPNLGDTTTWYVVGDYEPGGEFVKPGVTAAGWTVISTTPNQEGVTFTGWGDAQWYLDNMEDDGNPTNYDVLNVGDPDSNAGVLPFPKDNPGVDDNYYLLRANATLVIPQAGTYVLGFNSDDGAYMKIEGETFIDIIQNLTGLSYIDLTTGDSVICDCPTGNSGTTATIELTAGNYAIEYGMFEMTGGSYLQGRGAIQGAPIQPLLEAGGAGTFTVAPRIALTDDPADGGGGGNGDDITITGANVAGGNITVTWEGGGTLYSAPTVDGPWTTTGNSSGSFTEAATGAAKFYQVQQ